MRYGKPRLQGRVESGQLHVYIAPIHAVWYATTIWKVLEVSCSYINTSQLHGMLIKNGLG